VKYVDAIERYEKAIAADPNFALAYAQLTRALMEVHYLALVQAGSLDEPTRGISQLPPTINDLQCLQRSTLRADSRDRGTSPR